MLIRHSQTVCLVTLAFALAHARAPPQRQAADDAFAATFPIEIPLRDSRTQVPLNAPIGIVAALDTTMYVVSNSGQILLADIKTGLATILNPGGDDQRFTGICMDSRGPGTLYATGGETGLLYAFNRLGQLLRKYQITTSAADGGTSYLAACIQNRYQLLITDANNPFLYYLELADEGPLRGFPAVPDESSKFQGIRMELQGDWKQTANDFNAFGIEWTQKFNETGYVMNTATGEIFLMAVAKTTIDTTMEKVEVLGDVNLFPGALGIIFDSTNENVFYISIPHLNAIAVLEVARESPNTIKFIRYISNQLMEGPIAVGEYGDWIFPISGHFKTGKPRNGVYSIVQLPRHEQLSEGEDADTEFTTLYDDQNDARSEMVPRAEVQQAMKRPPRKTGKTAPPLVESPSDEDNSPSVPGSVDSPDSVSSQKEPSPAAPSPESTITAGTSEDSSSAEDSEPDGIEPDGSEPDGSEPDGSEPDGSELDGSEPDGSEPDDSEPDDESTIFGTANSQPDSEDSDGDSACFPSDMTVTLEGGREIRMDRLQIGDKVLTGWNDLGETIFSDIYMFSHQDETATSPFVSIKSSHGHSVELSPGHYMYINGRMAAASCLKEGDMIGMQNNERIVADSVERVIKTGLYNPQTLSGEIVVSGLRVSTYTSAVKAVVASALLAPLRAAHTWYRGWGVFLSSSLARRCWRIPKLLPAGDKMFV